MAPYTTDEKMLDDEKLEKLGVCARKLHDWYWRMSKAAETNDPTFHFTYGKELSPDGKMGVDALGRKELIDLFNLGPMSIQLMKCYELDMCKEDQRSPPPKHFAFLDPEKISRVSSKDEVASEDKVDYIARALEYYKQKDRNEHYIMVPYLDVTHWILFVILPKLNKIWYFNSLKKTHRITDELKGLFDSAYQQYCKKINEKSEPADVRLHRIDVRLQGIERQCHQQGSDEYCGYYLCHHMRLLTKYKDVPAAAEGIQDRCLNDQELNRVQEELCHFIYNEVIDNRASGVQRARFYCPPQEYPGLVAAIADSSSEEKKRT